MSNYPKIAHNSFIFYRVEALGEDGYVSKFTTRIKDLYKPPHLYRCGLACFSLARENNRIHPGFTAVVFCKGVGVNLQKNSLNFLQLK
jgi:hypothetical protein